MGDIDAKQQFSCQVSQAATNAAQCVYPPVRHIKGRRIPERLALCESVRTSREVSVNDRTQLWQLFHSRNMFQHSGRRFHAVLRALAAFAKKMIKLASFSPEIVKNIRYYIWFRDFIRAIDGTHMPVDCEYGKVLPLSEGYLSKQQRGQVLTSLTLRKVCSCSQIYV